MKRSKLALLPPGLAPLLAVCASNPLPILQHSFRIYTTASTPSAASHTLADSQGKVMLVALKPNLTQAGVLRAEVLYDQNGRSSVEVTFTEPAACRLAALTGKTRGRTLVVLVDRRLRPALRVRKPIRNGKVYLDGLASAYETRELADRLNTLGSQPRCWAPGWQWGSERLNLEGIVTGRRAALEAGLELAYALRRGAMGEGIRYHYAAAPTL